MTVTRLTGDGREPSRDLRCLPRALGLRREPVAGGGRFRSVRFGSLHEERTNRSRLATLPLTTLPARWTCWGSGSPSRQSPEPRRCKSEAASWFFSPGENRERDGQLPGCNERSTSGFSGTHAPPVSRLPSLGNGGGSSGFFFFFFFFYFLSEEMYFEYKGRRKENIILLCNYTNKQLYRHLLKVCIYCTYIVKYMHTYPFNIH